MVVSRARTTRWRQSLVHFMACPPFWCFFYLWVSFQGFQSSWKYRMGIPMLIIISTSCSLPLIGCLSTTSHLLITFCCIALSSWCYGLNGLKALSFKFWKHVLHRRFSPDQRWFLPCQAYFGQHFPLWDHSSRQLLWSKNAHDMLSVRARQGAIVRIGFHHPSLLSFPSLLCFLGIHSSSRWQRNLVTRKFPIYRLGLTWRFCLTIKTKLLMTSLVMPKPDPLSYLEIHSTSLFG